MALSGELARERARMTAGAFELLLDRPERALQRGELAFVGLQRGRCLAVGAVDLVQLGRVVADRVPEGVGLFAPPFGTAGGRPQAAGDSLGLERDGLKGVGDGADLE